jgi:hypothetical protein
MQLPTNRWLHHNEHWLIGKPVIQQLSSTTVWGQFVMLQHVTKTALTAQLFCNPSPAYLHVNEEG